MHNVTTLFNKAMARTRSSGGCTHVFWHLANCGGYVTVNELVSELGMHVKTIRKAVRCLDALGLVARDASGVAAREKVPPHVLNNLRAMASGTTTFDTNTELFTPPFDATAQGSEPTPSVVGSADYGKVLVSAWVPNEWLGSDKSSDSVSMAAHQPPFADSAGSEPAPATAPIDSPVAPAAASRAHAVVFKANATADAKGFAIANAHSIANANNQEHAPARRAIGVSHDATHRGSGLPKANAAQTQMPFSDIADTNSATKEVFGYWKLRHPGMSLTDKRLRCLLGRFAEGFTVEQLKLVIDWAARDPWMSGTDPKSTRSYDDIPNLFGSANKVEQYLMQARRPTGRKGVEFMPAATGEWAQSVRE